MPSVDNESRCFSYPETGKTVSSEAFMTELPCPIPGNGLVGSSFFSQVLIPGRVKAWPRVALQRRPREKSHSRPVPYREHNFPTFRHFMQVIDTGPIVIDISLRYS